MQKWVFNEPMKVGVVLEHSTYIDKMEELLSDHAKFIKF